MGCTSVILAFFIIFYHIDLTIKICYTPFIKVRKMKNLKKYFNKILKIMFESKQQKKEIEIKVCKILRQYPKLSEIQIDLDLEYICDYEVNIGMIAARLGYENIVIETLENEIASVQRNANGQNIGMVAALNGLENATLKALENFDASIMQDKMGNNIGIYSAKASLHKAVLMSRLNKISSNQINLNDESIKTIKTKSQSKTLEYIAK